MRTHVRVSRPHRASRVSGQLGRPVVRSRNIARADRSALDRNISAASDPSSSWSGFQPDPYVDYGRFLTPEGGILIIFKDLDLRLRHTLWRLFAWTASTGGEAWYLYHYSPLQSVWVNLGCLLAIGVLNWLIVAKPVELYRRVEIRPDCMILEGGEIFWLKFMENGLPEFRKDEEGNQVLSGIYGTRFVEYVTLRQFDEEDRMPEVFAAHLQEAMRQLWASRPRAQGVPPPRVARLRTSAIE
jgi:hypothetical protein